MLPCGNMLELAPIMPVTPTEAITVTIDVLFSQLGLGITGGSNLLNEKVNKYPCTTPIHSTPIASIHIGIIISFVALFLGLSRGICDSPTFTVSGRWVQVLRFSDGKLDCPCSLDFRCFGSHKLV